MYLLTNTPADFGGFIVIGAVVLFAVIAYIRSRMKKTAPEAPVPEAMPVTVTPVEAPAAPGSAGRLKIYNVPPKTAAMLMAIVAHRMGKPLNELRFISIKEVK